MLFIKLCWSTRIGNWMFQYAHARKLVGNDAPIAFYSPRKNDRENFQKYMKYLPGVEVVGELPPNCPMVHSFEEESFRKKGFPFKGDYLLDGYYQDVAAIEPEQVNRLFACPKDIKEYLLEKYPCLSSGETLVGVSVRRGDYLRFPHLHPFVGDEYLTKTVLMWDSSVRYVVCSDDIPWCKEFFSAKRFSGRKFTFVEKEQVMPQIYIHTMCHHNVLSNSSFAWWGAFLGYTPGKRVIFPSMWFGMSFGYSYPTGLLWPGCEIVGNGYTLGMHIRASLLDKKAKFRKGVGKVLRSIGFSRVLNRRLIKKATVT